METLEILSERVFKAGYILRQEIVEAPDPDEPAMEWTMAYTPSGDYIGDSKWAHRLCVKRGIRPEKNKPDHCTCSIGFSSKDGKWYGWSHRAIFGFKIGSTCKDGDCHYRPRNRRDFREDCKRFWAGDHHEDIHAAYATEDGAHGVRVTWRYGDDTPNEKIQGTIAGVFTSYPEEFGKGEWTAKTVADAKQMACDFAESVS